MTTPRPDGGTTLADGQAADAGTASDGGDALPPPIGDAGADMNVPPPPPPPPPPGGVCSDLFDPNVLQTYAIDISADEWNKLMVEFNDIADVMAGNPPENFHPITVHFGAETVTNAMIRLKGQSSWVQTIQNDLTHPKAQFVIAFDQVNPNTKLHGVSKIDFDMPRSDWTFLNERMANTWFREIGIMAPCANSGKLYINGQYYGLYVTEETKGDHLIKDFFPTPPVGDFIKGGTTPTNNLGMTNNARLQQWKSVSDVASLAAIVDVPHSLLEWAAEAVLNDADGYYGGGHNFYIYDQGAAGYVWIPTDKDATIEWMSVFSPSVGYHQHPIYWWVGRGSAQAPRQHYLIAMNDADVRARYVQAIATQLQGYDVTKIQGRFDSWSQQIASAVQDDPNKWATFAQFQSAVVTAKNAVAQRATYLQSFLDCERNQTGDDADGDGFRWCEDCHDDDAAIHPGAAEECNGVDDNCNGVIDEGCPPPAPAPPPPPPAM